MTLDVSALDGPLTDITEHPDLVRAVQDAASHRDAAYPFLLLPVRIETRFARGEVAVTGPSAVTTLAGELGRAADALEALAARDYATGLPTGRVARQAVKRDVEDPLVTAAESDLATVAGALAGAPGLIRDIAEGAPDEAAAIEAAAGRAVAALPRAAAALAGLRSTYHRDRMLARLSELEPLVLATAGDAPPRAHAATSLFAALGTAAPGGVNTRMDIEVPQHRLTESAVAHQELLELLADPQAGSSPDRLARARQLCAEIAALPEPWKAELLGRLEAAPASRAVATERAELLAAIEALPALERSGPDQPFTVRHVVDQLKVRIFPDDVAVRTHEEDLTQAEVDAGTAYWTARAAAGGDETAARAAWRALCAKLGSNRAAWVAGQTRPPDPPPPDPAVTGALDALRTLGRRLDEAGRRPGDRTEAVLKATDAAISALSEVHAAPEPALGRLRAAVEGVLPRLREYLAAADRESDREPDNRPDQLVAALKAIEPAEPPTPDQPPVAASRTAPWTRPPQAGLLPERFAVVTVAGGAISHVAIGNPVPADLPLGLDPTQAPEADGDLPAALRWMVDYPTAEQLGMAITLTITPEEAATGFERVYVLGLTAEADPDQTAAALADLLDGHHFGPNGLALVPVGAPTNATQAAGSGYRSRTDSDATYPVEQGPGLVTTAADPAGCDGGRLASALGVPAGLLDHVAGAGGSGVSDAVTANAALWPATMGYALEELLGVLVGPAGRDWLRELAVHHTIGRGSLPTLRVGPQPYGVLPTTAFSRWETADDLEGMLHATLTTMWPDWTAARQALVPHAHSGITGDPQQHVLEVLGLDATAASFEQRFTINAGRRGGGLGRATLHIGLPPLGAPPNPASAFALLSRFADVLERAGHGSGPLQSTTGPHRGSITDAWADTYDQLEGSRGYEVRLLAETVPLEPATAPTDLATRVNAMLAASLDTLRAAPGANQSLLLLLLRQALLVQAREVALRIVAREGLLSPDTLARLGSGDLFRFATRTGDVHLTRWSVLLGRLERLIEVLADPATTPGHPLPGYLTAAAGGRLAGYVDHRGDNPVAAGYPAATGQPDHQDLLSVAAEHAAAVRRLGGLPPPAVDQLLAEHLDVCSHRLDAWLLALPSSRLTAMRQTTPTGVHVGAFGWVEDLTPRPALPAPATLPAVLDDDPTSPVRLDPGNAGFVHAPSLNHAVTAAILRSGYLVQRAADPGSAGRMAVNVTSRRTRAALDTLDGIAAGNEFGALLGYHLERDLHDGPLMASGAALDVLIPRLRRAFPSVVPVEDAAAGNSGSTATGAAARAASEASTLARAERLVVDGLAVLARIQSAITRGSGTLLADLRAGGYAGYPYGLTDADGPMLPARSDLSALEAVLSAIDRIADTVDAIGDLVLTEGVYQLVQGNHVRAAAALSALAEGTAPPRPEVADTPVPGRHLSHRVLVQLPPVDARDPGTEPLASGWDAVPVTPRAAAEPSLNRWLGTLIGPPGHTRVRLVDGTGAPAREVTLTALGLQPIDLLAAVHDGFEEGLGELAARALDAVRPIDVRDGEPAPVLQVDLEPDSAWPAHVRGLPETAALLEHLAAAITSGRAADAGDYLLADTAPATPGATVTVDSASGVDLDELRYRVDTALDGLGDLGGRLLALLSDGTVTDPAALGDPAALVDSLGDTYRGGAAVGEHLVGLDRLWLRRGDLREALLAAGAYGIRGTTPPTRWLSRDQVGTELLEAAEAAFVGVVTRWQAARRALGTPAAGEPVARARLLDTLRAVFGESMPVLPLFRTRNGDELTAGLQSPPTAEPAVAVARWLTGAAAVREPTAALSTALVLAEAFGTPPPAGQPVQLPLVDGDTWLAEEFGPAQPLGDRLSLVVLGPEHLDTSDLNAGLLVDSWSEVIPASTVTTGLTFHYDSPDATPPQCLLLAVPPATDRPWQWTDLLLTVHETFELAKDRAVEPQHLHGQLYGQVLPALLGEVPAYAGDSSAGGHRVVLDFAAARAATEPT